MKAFFRGLLARVRKAPAAAPCPGNDPRYVELLKVKLGLPADASCEQFAEHLRLLVEERVWNLYGCMGVPQARTNGRLQEDICAEALQAICLDLGLVSGSTIEDVLAELERRSAPRP